MHSSQKVPKTTSLLLLCRGCLATDVRLHDIRQNRLLEAYTILVNTKEDLPHFLCSCCATLLLKYKTFRTKCLDAQYIIRNAKLENGQPSMEHIKQMSIQYNTCSLPYIRTMTQTSTIKAIGKADFKTMVQKESNIAYEECFEDSEFSMSEDEGNSDNDIQDVVDNDEVDKINDNDENHDNDEPIKGSDFKNDEFNDITVFNKVGNIKPDLIINHEINDHDYALNESANKHISDVVQKYLQKIGNSDMLNKFQVNLYCNQTTLAKINENKKMKLKIVDQVNSKDMNDKLHNLLRGKSVKIDSQITANKNHYIPTSFNNGETKTEIVKPKISNNGKYITIDFEEMDTDNNFLMDNTNEMNTESQNDLKCIKINTKPDNMWFKNNPNVDPEKFAKYYNMDVVCLYTKEDQIQYIEDKKKTNNYLHGNFKCEYCFKGFLWVETYKKHMLVHSESRGKFVCQICNYHFVNKNRLNLHRRLHSYKFICKGCSFTTSYINVAKDHHMWHTGEKFACDYCGKQYNGGSSYYTHLKVAHPTSDELVRCEMCGDSFFGTAGIKQHEKMAHIPINFLECLCPGCDTQFYCSAAFKAHRGTDGLCDATHKYCVRCGMAFETEQLLKEHEIEQVKPRDVFECKVCNKKFSNYPYYKAHSACHMERSLYRQLNQRRLLYQVPTMCEICGVVLKSKGLLKVHHKMKHTNERPHQCTHCPKKFKSTIALKVHNHRHTGERPYQCHRCPKAFQSPSNLQRHQITHTGDRPHMCTMCGKTFKTTTCLKLHIKTVHLEIPTTAPAHAPRMVTRRNKTEPV